MVNNTETLRGRVANIQPSSSPPVNLQHLAQQIRALTKVVLATQQQLISLFIYPHSTSSDVQQFTTHVVITSIAPLVQRQL